MADVSNLLEKALDHGPSAEAAVSELVRIGVDVAPLVLNAMRRLDPRQSSVNLQRVIVALRDPRVVPLLVEAIHDRSMDVVRTAFAGLGQFRDAAAVMALREYVSSDQNREARRALAASTLGRMRDSASIESLLHVVDESSAHRSYELALAAVIALAMLGNHDNATLPIRLALDAKEPSIRPRIAETLEYVVGHGLVAALQTLLRDKQVEVRLHAMNGLFYLGIRESVAALATQASDRNAVISDVARARLADLTGVDVETDPTTFRTWWDGNQGRFARGVCHRLGKPISVPDVIELLQEPNMRERTMAELKLITGTDFAIDPLVPIRSQAGILDRARSWWEREGSTHFKAGRLYKYGHSLDLSVVLAPIP